MAVSEHLRMNEVADYLESHKQEILEKWKTKVEASEVNTSRLVTLSRDKFFNHLPDFLNNLIQYFRGKPEEKSTAGKDHGEQRWEYGVDLQQLTKEWGLLHEVLIEDLKPFFSEQPDDLHSIIQSQIFIARNIHKGIKDSVDKYYHLETLKAEAQLRNVRKMLHEKEKVVKDHSNGLQRTSHDIKGNVLTLQIAVSHLKDFSFDQKKVKQIVSEMDLAVENLHQMLNELMVLFRLEARQSKVQVTSFDVACELEDLCKSMHSLAEKKGLDLQFSGDETLPVQGDRQKVRRIAQNLLLNALKYTESGYVKINWKKESNSQWLLTVSDTGPGLPDRHTTSVTGNINSEKHPENIPAENNSNEAEQDGSAILDQGEGIGLLIVRELCELVQAYIEVETTPGDGTVFRIMFPVDITKT